MSVKQAEPTGSTSVIPKQAFAKGDAHYQEGYHHAFHGAMLEQSDVFEARAMLQAETYFTAEERAQRIFEYGCGIGQGIAALPNAAGWDISSEAVEACRARGLSVYASWDAVPRETWDIVFCRHVLEHLERPLDALVDMRTLLKPNGRLFLVLPKEHHYEPPMQPDYTQHLYCWNFLTINNLLFRAGYRPIVNRYLYPFGGNRLVPLVRRRFGHGMYSRVSRAGAIFRRNGELFIQATLA